MTVSLAGDVSAIQHIEEVGGRFYLGDGVVATASPMALKRVDELSITTTALTDLTLISNLEAVNTIDISRSSLTSLAGLEQVTGSISSLTIEYNNNLNDLLGLAGVTEVLNDVVLTGGNNQTSWTGLHNIVTIGGTLDIYLGSGPQDLTGLEGLETIKNLDVNNTELVSFDGLTSLKTITNKVYITNNDHLESLSGLDNLETIGGEMRIGINAWNIANGNDKLTDFCAIADVDFQGNYKVRNNAYNPSKSDLQNGNCKQD